MKPTAEKSAGSSQDIRYRGVRKRKWGKYVSEIRLPNSRNRIWLGSYDSAEKAARAFDAAMFCLRGRNARFNFPHDPPNIPGGESLTPLEIQAAATRFANEVPHAGVTETSCMSGYASPSSVSDGGFPADGDLTGDWSLFLDSLGPPDSEASANATQFGSFFNEFDDFPGEICLSPVETDFSPEIGFSQQSFLWNF